MAKAEMTKKLIFAALSLLMAVVLLVGGTFAWYTMSKAPEVDGIKMSISYDGTQWPFEISLDYDPNTNVEHSKWDKVATLPLTPALLRPITTYNMQYWYITDYDENGNVDGFTLVPDIEDIANKVYVYEDDGSIKVVTDKDGTHPMDPNNYVVYYDVWIRAMDDDHDYELRLNNPKPDGNGGYKVDVFEDYYGTFLVNDPTAELSQDLRVNGDDLMSAMRVGFLFYDTYGDENTGFYSVPNYSEAYIWEPNGDMHNGLRSADVIEYINRLGTDANIEVAQYGSQASDSHYYYTPVPVPADGPGEGVDSHVDVDGNRIYYSYLYQDIYMRQSTSRWVSNIDSVPVTNRLESNNLEKIGDFKLLSGGGGLEGLQTLEAPYTDIDAMALIKSHEPKLVRIFFWIEGQDIDCWNQVAGGSMYANIEFRGDPVPHNQGN